MEVAISCHRGFQKINMEEHITNILKTTALEYWIQIGPGAPQQQPSEQPEDHS
jgi:hypothetical protein